MNHIDSNNHWKNELTEQVLGKKKCCNIKNVHFKKKDLKKLKTKTFLHFITTFRNFAFKVESDCATIKGV